MIRVIDRWLLTSGQFFFRFRNALFPLMLGALVLFARPDLWGGSRALDFWITAGGVTIALIGQAFRLLVIGYAYIKRGGKNREVFANELVTRGFYAHLRNPMYVGNFLIIVGLTFLYGSVWVACVTIPLFAWIYLAIVTAEEAFLGKKFGEAFVRYERKVNRFIPTFKGLRSSLAEFRYDWRRALVKEYNTLVFALASIIGLLAWKISYIYGFESHRTGVIALLLGLIPLALFYLSVRFLKKTHRLKPARKAESEKAF